MNKLLFITLFIGSITFGQNITYKEHIITHRHKLNDLFKDKSNSPLPRNEVKKFKELPFFKVDEHYKVEAKLKYTFNSSIVSIKNSKGLSENYQQYALATFSLLGEKYVLSIYQSLALKNKRGYENYLFIPFTDTSNGKTTYSGGRYLDAKIPAEQTGYITLDFNKAYNPYCAYNKLYVCPIPPKNNHLKIEILAGVKK